MAYDGLSQVWKSSPLLVVHPPYDSPNISKEFSVLIDGERLQHDEILAVGREYTVRYESREGEPAREVITEADCPFNKIPAGVVLSPKKAAIISLTVTLGYASQQFRLQAIEEETLGEKKFVHRVIEDFLAERDQWDAGKFKDLRNKFDYSRRQRGVPASFCDGFRDYFLAFEDYSRESISYGEKLLSSARLLLPFIDFSDFARLAVLNVHYIQNHWKFISKISESQKAGGRFYGEVSRFFESPYEDLIGNFSCIRVDGPESPLNRNLLFERDEEVLKMLTLIHAPKENVSGIQKALNRINAFRESHSELDYPESRQRELFLEARLQRSLGETEKARSAYLKLKNHLLNHSAKSTRWMKEIESFTRKS